MEISYEKETTLEIHNYDTVNPHLKNCPFCGVKPVWHLTGNDTTPSRTVVIKCPNCDVEMQMSGRIFGVQQIATRIMEKWNCRTVLSDC